MSKAAVFVTPEKGGVFKYHGSPGFGKELDGRLIYILSGALTIGGRVSNFFTAQIVAPNGKLLPKIYSFFGGNFERVQYTLDITVHIIKEEEEIG